MEHGGQEHQALEGTKHGQVTATAEHDPANPRAPRPRHGLHEQSERPRGIAVRHHVVARLEGYGVDRGGVDELLDVDGTAAFGRDRLQLIA